MGNTREKLIELLKSGGVRDFPFNAALADRLIANGVTIQKEAKLYWKPIKKGLWHLTCSGCDSHLGCREEAKHCPECGAKFVKYEELAPEIPEEA